MPELYGPLPAAANSTAVRQARWLALSLQQAANLSIAAGAKALGAPVSVKPVHVEIPKPAKFKGSGAAPGVLIDVTPALLVPVASAPLAIAVSEELEILADGVHVTASAGDCVLPMGGDGAADKG